MSDLSIIALYLILTLTSYLFSISSLSLFYPQFIALSAIILICFLIRRHLTAVLLTCSFIVSLLVFTTNGLSSPFFFLVYFLLFVFAFLNRLSVTFSSTLILIFFLLQTLDSPSSLLPLFSLALITPIVWFISKLKTNFINDEKIITKDETDTLLWLSLKFHTGIAQVLTSLNPIVADPDLKPNTKHELSEIQTILRSLLRSSKKLVNSIQK